MIDGLQRIAAVADDVGVRLGLEPIHASERDALTLITSIPEALELLDEAGLPDVGIMVDLWHLWDTPEIERHLADNVDRITGVHVANWFEGEPRRRALPGEGVSRTAELMRVLRDAGWQGAWDVEIFGDPARPDFALVAGRRRGRTPRLRRDRDVLERAPSQSEHVRDERLRVVVDPDLAHRLLTLVPGGEREPLIAVEALEKMVQESHPDLDAALPGLAGRCARGRRSRRTPRSTGSPASAPRHRRTR